MSTTPTPWKPRVGLSPLDSLNKLKWADDKMNKAKESIREMAEALRHIKDTKAWEGHYDSFEECCHARWGFKKSMAYNVLKADSVQSLLLSCSSEDIKEDVLKMTPTQLIGIANEEPKEVLKAMRSIKKKGGEITASSVKRKTSPTEVLPPDIHICSKCHQPIKKPRPPA